MTLRAIIHRGHVCLPPGSAVIGTWWTCGECWSAFEYGPVMSRELGQTVNLWVRRAEPVWRVRRVMHRRRTP